MTWRLHAACDGTAVDFFDPEQTNQALAICAGCPVVDDCLADAIETGSTVGVRGGLNFNSDKRRTKRPDGHKKGAGAPRQPIRHGTEAGAKQHRRRGEKPCRACLDGQARATADRKARRKEAA